MNRLLTLAALGATAAATPAFAQDARSWTGAYFGVTAGYDIQPGDGDERVNFDTNLDGSFNDVVRTGAGANAFSPGFCGGAARGTTPASGCKKDDDSLRLALHAGFDYDLGGFVVGAAVEGGIGFAEDYVTAYSTTPAFYTMTRRVREQANGRLRAGYAFNDRLRQTWAYTLTDREVYDIAQNASRYIQEQKGETLLSQLGQTLTYDFRDSIIDPRRGGVVRVGTDFAGLGGDVAYIRARLDGSYYIPFEQYLGDPDYVLSISAGVGYL